MDCKVTHFISSTQKVFPNIAQKRKKRVVILHNKLYVCKIK